MEIYSLEIIWKTEERRVIKKETLYDSLDVAKYWAEEFEWQYFKRSIPMDWSIWRMESEDGIFNPVEEMASGETKPIDVPEPDDDASRNREVKKGVSILSIKRMLCENAGEPIADTFEASGYYEREFYDEDYKLRSEANGVIDAIATGNYGIASEMAKVVQKYHRFPDFYDYWIAKAAWKNEIDCIFSDETAITDFQATEYDV